MSRSAILDRTPIFKMQNTLLHRGPDSTGQFDAVEISMGVQRLNIIDLVHGQQPLYNEDRSLVLVANGEIYNFVELRQELKSRGHYFNTGSDCETILHLYEEFGIDCVHHLRGMFAFALWDQKERQLILARDRVGEKPLYLYETDGRLVFASELKALLSSGIVPFVLDPNAIDLYFHYGYVPDPLTPLKGIRKLPAAHILILKTNPWTISEKCYWRMDQVPALEGNPGQILRAELESVSKIIVRSDVPVGVALSGGIDSGAVLALVANQYPGTLHAFSVGYPGAPPCDERKDAKMLADYLKIPFHDVELATEEVVAFFPDLIYRTDDPIADIAGSGYYSVMKLAKENGVPVMIQGQGGDELFWGYPWVVQAVKESTQKGILHQKKLTKIFKNYFDFHLPELWSPWGIKSWVSSLGGLRQAWERLQRHKNAPSDRLVFYDLTADYKIACSAAPVLYTDRFIESLDGTRPSDLFTFPQPWHSLDVIMTRLISETYLLENGIAQADRLSMACSVEARLPLVDYRFIETVLGLRRAQSDFNLPPKTWLKDALKDIVPDWVLRKPKRGFEPPVREWHRAIFDRHGLHLRDGYLVSSDVLKPDNASTLADGPFPKGANCPLSFKALVLELWSRKFSSLGQ